MSRARLSRSTVIDSAAYIGDLHPLCANAQYFTTRAFIRPSLRCAADDCQPDLLLDEATRDGLKLRKGETRGKGMINDLLATCAERISEKR